MEFLLAVLKVINPFEWLKENYKLPIGAKMAILITCILIVLFVPLEIRGINIKILHTICIYLVPIQFICLVGSFIQGKIDKKKAEEEENKRLLELGEQKKLEEEMLIKKAKDKERQEELEYQNRLKKYFELFDLCAYDERKILEKFYCNECTTIRASSGDYEIVRAMNSKGIDVIKSAGVEKAVTNPDGLKIIKSYFDRDLDKFFNFVNSLSEKHREFLNFFLKYNDTQVEK